MQLPGMFVEYLVSGSVAMVWLIPLLSNSGYLPQNIDAAILALLLPSLYVLGMIIDFVGWLVLRPYRMRLKRDIYQKNDVDESELYAVNARLLTHAPELAKTIDMFSSRDRVARGTVVNAVFSTIVFVAYFWQKSGLSSVVAPIVIGIVVTSASLVMWKRYQSLSYRFEIHGLRALNEKLAHDREAEGTPSEKIAKYPVPDQSLLDERTHLTTYDV